MTTVQKPQAMEVVRALTEAYPRRSGPPRGGMIDHLAASVIGRYVTRGNVYTIIHRMMEEFVDWNEVRVARCGELERILSIGVTERATETARRLVACLQQIFDVRGNLDIDGLAQKSPSEAKKFLQNLEGIDRDEVDLIMLIGSGEQILPIDNDILRMAKRIGIVSQTATRLQAQKALEGELEGMDLHECHHAMREHSEKACAETPACSGCAVSKMCESAGSAR